MSEPLLYAMVVISPWAFGSTQDWSVWVMNGLGYALGLLWVTKLAVRWFKGYKPQRWIAPARGGLWTVALAVLTILVLTYCLCSALNAGATFRDETLSFEYRPCIKWLPHSYDAVGTWLAFWRYLGLACAFWASRDWLLGKCKRECDGRTSAHLKATNQELPAALPGRLRRLLWVLAVNGALLGLEAIVQRLAGEGRLLFLVQPRIHQSAAEQFGPYAYRANAAQYFNLAWPVCLGFWWLLQSRSAHAVKSRHWLLVCAIIMAACPAASGSRAGAAVALCQAVACAGLFCCWLVLGHRHDPTVEIAPGIRGLVVALVAALVLGLGLGWPVLGPRLALLNDGVQGRESLYAAARPMAQDFPWIGTGPGTFETVSYLYPRPDIYWPPQLHNDWLETRITFGATGSLLLGLVLLLVVLRWFVADGIKVGRGFTLLGWIGLAGCLAHARYDFPFQVYSVTFLFVLICAVLCATQSRAGDR